VLEYAQPVGDADITIAANLQLGFCLRTLAQWREAMLAYATAGRAASAVGDVVGVLRARVGEGKLAIDRGNLPEAEMILDETIENAVGSGLQSVRAVALHDRAHVAHMRGQFDRAINLGYEALSGTDDPTERDRVLGDLGASFFELGLRDAARDAQLILASTAQQQSTRWAATINLLEIAGSDGSEAVFEQYRRELANNPLPAFLAAQYHYHVGEGYKKLKKQQEAREAYRRAVEIAQANELNQILFKAEGAMREIEDGGVVLVSEAKPFAVSSEVRHAADAIREMRVLACVGA
jgi:tetratricopeptide (TPR) repeat protein